MKLKPENIELSDKIMAGIHEAVRKLIIDSAANDEKLVIADEEGNVKHVPAKELLKGHSTK
ncbi:hypothetical protein [Pedobacter heparinus]|uniref:Uncharacterized protein n=1 Tax=Pedobacter heparinus (strain ATCC 13125 / DSM 2366 / CIP 104194 / JCM 7457 / NBRC 12017 / NCIMB 9290 / NRRL B-14731 / HIM 762-3) TaxID=485917 RepID=C6XUM7_PEDHD|nr:hypothetical protein [Pedobacter heparinus]ACU03877.1 hypothetical protein Phep_1666 [Pedobacter heparinus DSM 2366]